MIVEIQCLPRPGGTPDNPHAHVEAAIEVIAASGLTYEVGPLGTSIEGHPDQLWPLMRAAHEACLAHGAEASIAVVKVFEVADAADDRTMASLTDKFRSP
jgi:uncharacterized protein YqgV (UPF0045/DUF77 family)